MTKETIISIGEIECEHDGTYSEGYQVVTSEQTILALIDAEQDCCEVWGYFWSNDNPDDFIGAAIESITLTDTGLNTKELPKDEYEPTATMFVNFNTDRGILQFTAYNSHNGYYGHMARIISHQLTQEEVL